MALPSCRTNTARPGASGEVAPEKSASIFFSTEVSEGRACGHEYCGAARARRTKTELRSVRVTGPPWVRTEGYHVMNSRHSGHRVNKCVRIRYVPFTRMNSFSSLLLKGRPLSFLWGPIPLISVYREIGRASCRERVYIQGLSDQCKR